MDFGIIGHDNERLHLSFLAHPPQQVDTLTVGQAQVGKYDVTLLRFCQQFLGG